MDQTLVNVLLTSLFAANLVAVRIIYDMVIAKLGESTVNLSKIEQGLIVKIEKIEADVKKDLNGIAATRVTKSQCDIIRTLHDERVENIRRDIESLISQGSKEHHELNRTLEGVGKSLKELERCVTMLGAGKDC